jgi:single-strand DNA-binding protein
MATICITGRLPRDCEQKKTQQGTPIALFSVPYNIGYGDNKQTVWAQCAMFGTRAEKVAPYLTKGTLVQITGVPQPDAYLKDGKAKSALKVNVDQLELHGGGQDRPVVDNAPATSDGWDDGGDSIPF